MKTSKKMSEAKKLKESISKLEDSEMYFIYEILEKNKVNITKNANGIFFDLLSLDNNIFKNIKKFVNDCILRKDIYKN